MDKRIKEDWVYGPAKTVLCTCGCKPVFAMYGGTRPIVDGPAYFSTDVETSSTMAAEQLTYLTATRMPSRKATRTTNINAPRVRIVTVLVRH